MGIVSIFCVVLSAVFIALKLANVIAWSWLWVLSPLWILVGLGVFFVIVVALHDALDDFLEIKGE